jgi:hypothetical protein
MSGEIFLANTATQDFTKILLLRPVLAKAGIRGARGVMKIKCKNKNAKCKNADKKPNLSFLSCHFDS